MNKLIQKIKLQQDLDIQGCADLKKLDDFLSLSHDKSKALENEITRLRAYVQRGSNLLHPLAGNKEIDEYRKRAEKVLSETLFI